MRCWAVALLGVLGVAGENWDHVVIVDAGSSGTRAHAYKFPKRVLSTKAYPTIKHPPLTTPVELGNWKTEPGLSSYAANPVGAGLSLREPLRKAAASIRAHLGVGEEFSLKSVKVYLGATAGMRILNDEDRDKIMHEVRVFLSSDDNPFHFRRGEQARVLAGEEEGAFGWIAANLRQNTLSSDPATTYGALDMGGDSTQMSFIPSETSVLANMFPMHIGNFVHGPIHLYTHSFLQYGFAKAFTHSGLLASFGQPSFDHPCLPPGLEWKVEQDKFGLHGGTRTNGSVTMRGSGSFWMCQTVVRAMMVKSFCTVAPCSLLGVYRPPLEGAKFLAFSEFKQNFDRMGITNHTVAPPLQALAARLATWCSMTVEEQAAVHNEEIGTRKAKIELSCWLGVWILELLTTGFGFPIDTRAIEVEHMEDDIGWAQGQAIYETSFYPYSVEAEDEGGASTDLSEVAEHAVPQTEPRTTRVVEALGWLSPALTAAALAVGASWGRRAERQRKEQALLG